MASGQDLVNQTMTDEESIPSSEVADSFYADLRAEILRDIQKSVNKLWLKDWPWKKTVPVAVVVTGGNGNTFGFGSLPANFQAFGHQMMVTVQNEPRRPPLRLMHLGDLNRARAACVTPVDFPLAFAIADQTAAGVRRIAVYPYLQVDKTVEVVFDKKPPTVADTSSTVTGLSEIPDNFHDVVFEMAVERRMRKKGDVRSATEQAKVVKDAIAAMVAAEIPSRGEISRMPPHAAARGFYRRGYR